MVGAMNKLDATAAPVGIHTYYQAPVSGNNHRYVGAGASLYRNFNYGIGGANAIITGLTGTDWPLATMRPLLGGKTYTYISDGVVSKKDDGTTVGSWGVVAPAMQAVLALGSQKSKVIDAMDATTGWTEVAGTMNLVADATFFIEGTASVKMNVTGTPTSAYYRMDKTLAVDLSLFSDLTAAEDADLITVMFATTKRESVKSVTVTLGVGGYTQVFTKTFLASDEPLSKLQDDSWLELAAARKDFTKPANSANTWAMVDRLRLQVNFASGSKPASGDAYWWDGFKMAGGHKLTGKYQFRWIYVVKSGAQVLAKSNPYDPFKAGVTPNEIDVSRRAINLSGMTASADAQVTHKWIFRGFANNPSAFYFDGEVANATTTYTSSKSDSELGELLVFDNDTPTAMSDLAGPHFDRVWGIDAAVPDRVVFSKAKEPDSFPPTFYLIVSSPADPVKKLTLFEGVLYALTVGAIYGVQGTDEASFVAYKTRAERGTVALRSVAVGPSGLYYLAKDGIYLFDGLNSTLLTASIDPVFYGTSMLGIDAFNMAQAAKAQGAYFDGKYFLSYPHGANTTNTRLLVYDEQTRQFYSWDFSGASALHVEKVNNYLVVGAADGFAYFAENGLKNLVGDAPNATATIQISFRDPQGHGGLKVAKDFYADIDAPSAVTVTPIADGTAKTAFTVAATTDRKLTRTRIPAYKARLFEWRMKSASFFRLFGASVDMLHFRRAGYDHRAVSSQSG